MSRDGVSDGVASGAIRERVSSLAVFEGGESGRETNRMPERCALLMLQST